jgi:predicted protein tyrosine phosphatase
VIVVAPLHHAQSVIARRQPSHVISLFSPGHEQEQPADPQAARHLRLAFNDITATTPGLIAPDAAMVAALVDFGRTWQGERPLLIHCWAGISRSTAAAFILACERNPGRESDIAQILRARAPFATPNRLMVALADAMLSRGRRMIDAVESIGRGAEASTGEPFELPATWPASRESLN